MIGEEGSSALGFDLVRDEQANGFDTKCWLRKRQTTFRLQVLLKRLLLPLPRVCALFTAVTSRLSVDTTEGRYAVRAWGVLCSVRATWSHSPDPRARLLSCLTALVCIKEMQHAEHPRQRAPAKLSK